MATKAKSKTLVEVHTFASLGEAHPGETISESIGAFVEARHGEGWDLVSVTPLSAPEYLFVFKAA